MNRTLAPVIVVAVGLLGASAMGGVILQHESFENYTVGSGYYIDALDPLTDHWLDNIPATGHVVGGDGWGTFYTNTRDSDGLSDGDYFGVTDYTGSGVGSYTDGVQGFQMSDVDGMTTLTFDAVDGATGVTFDMFVQSTGWESNDRIIIEIGGEVILDTAGSDIDDLGLEGVWTEFGGGAGDLKISLDSNSGSEATWVDNIVWTGVPAPGALALLGLAGIAGRRRRRLD